MHVSEFVEKIEFWMKTQEDEVMIFHGVLNFKIINFFIFY